jgi:hypothetical protein
MPDIVERIVLDIDEAKAVLAAARANAALASIEKKAGAAVGSMGRVADGVGAGVIKASHASSTAIEKIVADAEKKAAAVGRTASQRLTAERDLILKRVSGDADAVKRVTDAYAKMGETGGGAFEKIKAGAGMVAGIAASVVAAGTAVYHFVKSQTDAAEAMQNLSDRTGLTLKEVDLYSAAARSANVNVDALVAGVRKLSEALGDNSEDGAKGKRALKELGVSALDSYQQLKPVGQLIEEIGAGLAKLPDTPAKLRAVTALFGRGGAELLPILKDLPGQLAGLRAIGYGIDDSMTKELLKADEALDKFWRRWELFWKTRAGMLVGTDRNSLGTALRQWTPEERRAEGFGQTVGDLKPPRMSPGPPGNWATGFVSSEMKATRRWDAFTAGSSEMAIQIRLGRAQEKLKDAIAAQDDQAVRSATAVVEALKKQNEALREQEQLVKKAVTERKKYMDDLREGAEKIMQQESGTRGLNLAYLTGAGYAPQFSAPAEIDLQSERAKETMDAMRDARVKKEAADERALKHDIRMIELRTGPGGELDAAKRIYDLRVAAGQVEEANFDREEQAAERQKRQFDELRSSFEGLFDAAFSGARGFWDAVKRMAMSVFLTPIKRELSNWVAGMLTGRTGATSGGGALTAATAVAGFGGFMGPMGMGLGGSMAEMSGGGGASVGSAGGGGIGSLAQAGGGIGLLAAIKGGTMTAAQMGALGVGGASLGLMGAWKAGQSGNRYLRGAAPAIGAVSGLVGFGALASMFPALIGAGPAGWLAAAGIGATIGIISLLRKSSEQKCIDKVQEIYRVRIDKGMASQIVEMAKSAYGGNLDMAIRAPQGRELIELYAMATGQNMMGVAAKQLPTTMSQNRGVISQVPSYYNGSIYTAPVTSTTGLGGGGTVNVSLDPQATREFLAGRMATAITTNPRAVATASLEAGRQSASRRELAAMVLQPGLVVA